LWTPSDDDSLVNVSSSLSSMSTSRGDPYEVFEQIENTLNIGHDGTAKERSKRIWTSLKEVWQEDRPLPEAKQALRRCRAVLKTVCSAVLHDKCAKSSRAKWLVSLKTMARIQCGLLSIILYAQRREVAMLLTIAPKGVLELAARMQEAGMYRGECVDLV
jgi:hypothetical protein